jgi:hypothetical protein
LSDFLQSPAARGHGLGQAYEAKRAEVVGEDWSAFLDRELWIDGSQHKQYLPNCAAELVRFFRNKWIHPPVDDRGARLAIIGATAEDYFRYYHERFPNFFLYSYYFAEMYAPNLL